MNAIEKKIYSAPVRPKISEFKRAYLNYLKPKIKELFELTNEYSRIDGLLISANTTTEIQIPVEFKCRTFTSISDYDNAFIEIEKYESLKKAKELIVAPFSFHIIEYSDCLLAWKLDFVHDGLKSDVLPTPISNRSSTRENTPIYYLEYDRAYFIVAKRTGRISRPDELHHYIGLKKTGCYNVFNYLSR